MNITGKLYRNPRPTFDPSYPPDCLQTWTLLVGCEGGDCQNGKRDKMAKRASSGKNMESGSPVSRRQHCNCSTLLRFCHGGLRDLGISEPQTERQPGLIQPSRSLLSTNVDTRKTRTPLEKAVRTAYAPRKRPPGPLSRARALRVGKEGFRCLVLN